MKTGEHCSLCLRKQGHVCYECCEDRHRLVKMELDELKARMKLVIKSLEGLGYLILPETEK